MAKYEIFYEGDLRTRAVHETGEAIETDAPKDNQGQGRMFSPTDLVGVALGSCILTVMGIIAKSMKIDLKGTRMVVSKQMAAAPSRRIGQIKVEIFCPQTFAPDVTARLQKAAENCPVHHSLHPEIEKEVVYYWGQA